MFVLEGLVYTKSRAWFADLERSLQWFIRSWMCDVTVVAWDFSLIIYLIFQPPSLSLSLSFFFSFLFPLNFQSKLCDSKHREHSNIFRVTNLFVRCHRRIPFMVPPTPTQFCTVLPHCRAGAFPLLCTDVAVWVLLCFMNWVLLCFMNFYHTLETCSLLCFFAMGWFSCSHTQYHRTLHNGYVRARSAAKS